MRTQNAIVISSIQPIFNPEYVGLLKVFWVCMILINTTNVASATYLQRAGSKEPVCDMSYQIKVFKVVNS